MLTQPVVAKLNVSRRVLLAGCGGGYDVLGAVPLLAELEEGGRQVHLASLSFTYLNGLDGALQCRGHPNLYEVPSSAATPAAYCPEAWLSRWIEERLGRRQSVWAFDKTGVQPLLQAYRHLVAELGIDAIVLVDGGVDSILRGDESSLGTPAEDLVSLAAVHALGVPTKIVACVGLGAEIRDGICHEQVFERIAELGRQGGYLGATALLPQTPAGGLYREAVEYVFRNQAEQKQSHIHNVVLAAMLGGAGADGPNVWLSPLLSHFLFFELDVVASTHLFLRDSVETEDIWEVGARIDAIRKTMKIRERSRIPI